MPSVLTRSRHAWSIPFRSTDQGGEERHWQPHQATSSNLPAFLLMFRRTLMRSAQEARKPMIRFPDRKAAPKGDHEPHPHPAAPQAVAKDFSHFQEVFQSGPHFHPEKIQTSASPSPSSSSSGGEVFDDLHDLPKRFWQTPSLLIGEREMDAINSGGATLVQK